MAPRYRSRRARLAALTTQLRAKGQNWAQIAQVIQDQERVNARVALRLAHGWTQEQVARRWNDQWPGGSGHAGITDKNISYWETWPQSGHEPSLKTLKRLAQLYQCDVGQLVDDGAYSHLDVAVAHVPPLPVASGSGRAAAPATAIADSTDHDLAALLGSAAEPDEDAMKRRSFLMRMAAFSGLGTLDASVALEATRHELSRALAGRDTPADTDEWHEIALEYGQTYQRASCTKSASRLV